VSGYQRPLAGEAVMPIVDAHSGMPRVMTECIVKFACTDYIYGESWR
jgi:hypothetical protein